MIDPLYSLSGFAVGMLVGMTGVGGGALMTPLLILLFGVHPATAVGTDLLYAAATKTGGSLVHGFARSIDWRVVRRLAAGSIPATVVTLAATVASQSQRRGRAQPDHAGAQRALFVTAFVLVFGQPLVALYRARVSEARSGAHGQLSPCWWARLLGVLVSISSVGAGAIGVVALMLLYPQLPMAKIVGSDIAHAVPLTLVAGIGHWMMGSVDWHIIASLLVGSLPGIFVGSYFAIRIPERALRLVLAATLFVVASRIAYDHATRGLVDLHGASRRAAP